MNLTVGTSSSKATAAIPNRLDLQECRLALHYPSLTPDHPPLIRQDVP
jgi:hypothetical protein